MLQWEVLMFHGLDFLIRKGDAHKWLTFTIFSPKLSAVSALKNQMPQTLHLKEGSELAGCSEAQGPWWRQLLVPAESNGNNTNAIISKEYLASWLLFGLSLKDCQGSVFLKLPGTCQLYHLLIWGQLGLSVCWPGLFSYWSDWAAEECVARGGGVLLCNNVNAFGPWQLCWKVLCKEGVLWIFNQCHSFSVSLVVFNCILQAENSFHSHLQMAFPCRLE